MPDLNAPLDQLCYIVVKAREFTAQVAPLAPDEASDSIDDRMIGILEDVPENPTADELTQAIESLNEDGLLDVLTLIWIGRGDYAAAQWDEARAEASQQLDDKVTDYLLDMPLLADYLQEGLSQLGLSCTETETGRL